MTFTSGRAARGFTLVDLSIVILILGVLLAMAVTTLFRARLAANESSAMSSLRTINQAQNVYQSTCGKGLFATSLVVLGTKYPGEGSAFLGGELGESTAPTHSGYTFGLGPGAGSTAGAADCQGVATMTRFYATARPVEIGTTGNRAFATNQSGAIYQTQDGTPPSEPFGPPAQLAK